MAELNTRPTTGSVTEFLSGVDESRRKDCAAIVKLMQQATGAKPRMWGTSSVGFGTHYYTYASSREGDWFQTGFSPRKSDITLQVWSGFDRHPDLMKRLGKFRAGKSCLYIKRPSDVDVDVLGQLIERSVPTPGART